MSARVMDPAEFWAYFEEIKKDLADEDAPFGIAMETLGAIVDEADEIEVAEVDAAFNAFLRETYPLEIEACERDDQERAEIAKRHDEALRLGHRYGFFETREGHGRSVIGSWNPADLVDASFRQFRPETVEEKPERLIANSTWKALALYDADLPDPQGLLCKAIFEPETVAMIIGPSGAGKTDFIRDLAHSIATGTDLGPYPARKGKVHIVSEEMTGRQMKRRLRKGYTREQIAAASPNLTISCKSGITIDTPEGRATLKELLLIEGGQPRIVFIDNQADALGDADENDNKAMRKIYVGLRDEVAVPLGCCVVMSHHTGNPGDFGKGDRGRGASCMEQIARDVLKIEEAAEGRRTIRFKKCSEEDTKPAPLDFIEEPKDGLFVSAYAVSDEQAKAAFNLDAVVLKAIVTGTPGQSTNRIRGKVGGRYSDLMASLGRLTAASKIREKKGAKGAKLWFPAPLES